MKRYLVGVGGEGRGGEGRRGEGRMRASDRAEWSQLVEMVVKRD